MIHDYYSYFFLLDWKHLNSPKLGGGCELWIFISRRKKKWGGGAVSVMGGGHGCHMVWRAIDKALRHARGLASYCLGCWVGGAGNPEAASFSWRKIKRWGPTWSCGAVRKTMTERPWWIFFFFISLWMFLNNLLAHCPHKKTPTNLLVPSRFCCSFCYSATIKYSSTENLFDSSRSLGFVRQLEVNM